MRLVLVLALLLVTSTSARALTLDFSGLAPVGSFGEQVLGYYDGGVGSEGSGPGPDLGIVFGPLAIAVRDSDAGGQADIANEPSPDVVLGTLGTAAMDVAAGFTGALEFSYSSVATGTVSIYDGLGGTGNLLTSESLGVTGVGPGDPNGGDFGIWLPVQMSFAGIARSVVFDVASTSTVFDDVTLEPVPEPSALLSAAIGLAVFAGARRIRSPRR
jgi:PEP-CTERM motif